MTKPLTIAAIGCGGRTRTYFKLAAEQPKRYQIIAAADPDANRLDEAKALSANPDFRRFHDDKAILGEERLADIMIIGTQDRYHVEQGIAAMELGYHLLLEKPMAVEPEGVERLAAVAKKHQRRVIVCHVLRYTPFYQVIRNAVSEGRIGKLTNFNATEGLTPWHYAHAFVRGQWSNRSESSPMILAKCCHDMDILRWIVDSPCRQVASFGRLSHFRAEAAPVGAPKRCLDGCPVADTCHYNAEKYLNEHRDFWLPIAMSGTEGASDLDIRDFLQSTRWGHCVYHTDNDVVDHQSLALDFDSGVTGTFTMHAFGGGRNLELYGTEGRIYAGEQIHQQTGHMVLHMDLDGKETPIDFETVEGGYDGHFGGDQGIMNALYDEMTVVEDAMLTSLEVSVESHRMAFAAEESRLSGQVVRLD